MKNLYFLLLAFSFSVAQPPQVFYTNPNSFTVNQSIMPLIPTYLGAPIPEFDLVATFAGSGTVGSADGAGTDASFNLPTVVTIGPDGTIFVVDRINNKIRKITAEGEVTTFAGSGAIGNADGQGANASFHYPDGAVADSQGNLFVSDQSAHTIRKITPDGTVSTFAGTGSIGAANGTGTAASFYYPAGMAVDSQDNLYVADYGNNKIRKITPLAEVTTFAGTGVAGLVNGSALEAQFNGATGVAVDASGNVFVADYYNNVIREIHSNGDVTTVAGSGVEGFADGDSLSAQFDHPAIVAVDEYNNLYVTDEENNRIRKISPQYDVTTLAGNGSVGAQDGEAQLAEFNSPTGLAVDADGRVYVCDYGNNKIRKIFSYGFSVYPPLPEGLTIDHLSGVISGTPTTISDASDYTIVVSNADGVSTFTITIAIVPELGIPQQQTETAVFYPNPVKNILHLNLLQGDSVLKVSDITGRNLPFSYQDNSFDFSPFAKGVYLLQIGNGSTLQTVQIIRD